jgi:hypothetical protein
VFFDSWLGSETLEAEGVEVGQNGAGDTLCDWFMGIACAVSSTTMPQSPRDRGRGLESSFRCPGHLGQLAVDRTGDEESEFPRCRLEASS